MKQCIHCDRMLPLSEFYRHAQMADGHLNACRDCKRSYQRRRNRENPERSRASDRAKRRKNPRLYAEAQKRWAKENRVRRNEIASSWRKRNKDKVRAQAAVKRAIGRGELVRQPCEQCGAQSVHAHHDDYTQPLDVRWLCPKCHGRHHQIERERRRERELRAA